MQRTVNRILEGNFDYENGSLEFSCAKIEIQLPSAKDYEGAFTVHGMPGTLCTGEVYSTNSKMECITTRFHGTDEEIQYKFHGYDLEPGEVVKGNFNIISNQGEYYLPFVVTLEHHVMDSSVGAIHNLFHFANLAKSNWQEAVKLFYSREFANIFIGNDARFLSAYMALSAVRGSEQNVEEFLIYINKKQKTEFILQEDSLEYDLFDVLEDENVYVKELHIIKNGWGFTRMYVECEGNFLYAEKDVLTDDDFLGIRCTLPVYVDKSMCRAGKNFGSIRLYNSYVSLEIPVTVIVGDNHLRISQVLNRKRDVLQLMELYEGFRTKKLHRNTWIRDTERLIDKTLATDQNDIAARLFQAQLLITEDKMNEAGWILDHAEQLLIQAGEPDTLSAYYLYLTTLLHTDLAYKETVVSTLQHMYNKDNSNWRVGWLLTYLAEDYRKSAVSKWLFLEKLYQAGCNSPIIYLEAVTLLNNNPSFLRRLDDFEMHVIWYGVRKDLLKADITEQILYACDKIKDYSPLQYRIMTAIYQKQSDVRVLQQICTLLIRGGRTENKYFKWYALGVENNLRITNLYEYYMTSIDLETQQKIPKIVLLYFKYQNSLDYEHTAYLYQYILENRDHMEDVYHTYEDKIISFSQDQITRYHVNRHLAGIYNRVITEDMIDSSISVPFSRIAFSNILTVENKNMKKVYVYQPGNKYPTEYFLNKGKTWLSLYGNNYTLVFEDANGNRFLANMEYSLEKLMLPGKYLRKLEQLPCENPELDLFLLGGDKEIENMDLEIAMRILHLLETNCVSLNLKKKFYFKLLQFYFDTEDTDSLNTVLYQIRPEEYTMEEKSQMIRFIILRGNMELAKEWLIRFGYEYIDSKLLVRMLSPLIEMSDYAYLEDMLLAAHYAFKKGKHDEVILEYLTMHFRGTTREMRDIWKVARAYGINCFLFSELILMQMMYSGAFIGEKMEIFEYYISAGSGEYADTNLRSDPQVELAFLTQCAYDFFVKDRMSQKEVYEELGRLYLAGEKLHLICKLAYTKYYSENKSECTGSFMDILEIFLYDLLDAGIHLEYFRQFSFFTRVAEEMTDRTIVEYHTNPLASVCIHYLVMSEDGEAQEYITEKMQEACQGVYFKEFTLFFGECLQFYVTESMNDTEQLTESGTIQKSDIGGNDVDCKYSMINDIIISKTLQDYDTMDKLLEEFGKKEFLNRKLFQLF